MPKINVYLPDELAEAVKAAGVPVSAVCQRALEQAVRRITAIRETGLGSPGLDGSDARFASFTQRARTAMSLAIEEARAGGAAEVGTEHLLGGLLAEGTNLALHVLRAVEVDPGQVRRELDALGRSDATPATSTMPTAPARFGGPAAAALELTVTEAVALGHNYVGCEHLLLGLVAEPEGTAGRVLRGLGAEPRLTRRAVTAALAGYVHLRAQHRSVDTDPLTETVRQELRPFVQRLERLEERLGRTARE
ncbi:Clp protease N-terminal domain-containing protein [Streptosporangium saharense]|uniref:ATP-dependent Clp protease ATP-binding subunit ClpC n=1 Tax=Streptosporangium saharense TaxID=1706840 RepID=A0A7W7VN98_9ACTN|nr:Clp protease N-terminal domain-containing protein [Streptosporangium saharense]MBB4916453.1 ATP-dependent Clp protease ATP-binding subunit ClpC [Streptosporangium saharense]